MNTVYKVIFCKASQTWIAVSELAKGRVKSSARGVIGTTTKINIKLSALLLSLLMLWGGSAHAGDTVFFNDSNDGGCYRLGDGSSHGNIGAWPNPDSNCETGDKATQMDRALFYDDEGKGRSTSLTLGQELYVNSGRLGLGGGNDNKIAIGDQDTLDNQATNGVNSIAIGVGASATLEGGVALGQGSVANVAKDVYGYKPTGALTAADKSNPAWKSGYAAISIGSDSASRQIINVAAGTKDTDAVNVAQLKAAQIHYYSVNDTNKTHAYDDPSNTSNKTNDGALGAYSLALGQNAAAYSTNSVAVGKGAQTGAVDANGVPLLKADGKTAAEYYNVAMGAGAKAFDNNSAAFGSASLASGTNSVAFGNQAKATGAVGVSTGELAGYATALGGVTKATGQYSTAIGYGSDANKNLATAIGSFAQASGVSSIAVGRHTKASDNSAIALGVAAQATAKNATAFGRQSNAAGENATALGFKSLANHDDSFAAGNYARAYGNGSIAIGKNSTINSTGDFAVAIGKGAKAQSANSIALGAGSFADRASSSKGYDPVTGQLGVDATINATKKGSMGAVSVGNATNTRQIINVAAGTADTDAVNIAQLKAAQTHYFSVSSTDKTAGSNWKNDGAVKDTNSIAIGLKASAGNTSTSGNVGTNAVAIGSEAYTTGQESVALGYKAKALGAQTIAIGSQTEATADQVILVGNDAKATKLAGVVIGGDDSGEGYYSRDQRNAFAGRGEDRPGLDWLGKPWDNRWRRAMSTGVGAVAIGVHAQSLDKGATAIGIGATAKGEEATAIGALAWTKGKYSTAIGRNAIAEAENSSAFGVESKASAAGGMAIGYKSLANRASGIAGYDAATDTWSTDTSSTWQATQAAVSVGDAAKNVTRQITGVAAGRAETDAVNVAQLKGATAPWFVRKQGGTDYKVKPQNVVEFADGTYTTVSIARDDKNGVNTVKYDLKAAPVLHFMGNDTAKIDAHPGNTINVVGGLASTAASSASNVYVASDAANKKLTIKIADAPTFAGKVTAQGGFDAGGNKITNVAKGTADSDGVNLDQVKQLIAANTTTTLTQVNANSPFAYKASTADKGDTDHAAVAVGDMLVRYRDPNTGEENFYRLEDMGDAGPETNAKPVNKNAAGIQITTIDQDGDSAKDMVIGNVANGLNAADAVNRSQLNPLATALGATIDSKTGEVQQPTYTITSVGAAATENKVHTVPEAISALNTEVLKKITFNANEGTGAERQLGDAIAIKGADANNTFTNSDEGENIFTKVDGNTIRIGLAKALSVDKVTTGTTVMDATGVSIPSSEAGKGNVTLTNKGLDNGGNKITGVADGTLAAGSNDVVTGGQLHTTNTNVTTNTNAIKANADNIGKGINVGGTSGSNNYALGGTINIKGDSNITSTTISDGVQLGLANTVTIGTDTTAVTIDGTTGKITNLTAGKDDTDAVNVSQLKTQVAASKEVVKSTDKSITVSASLNTEGANEYDLAVNADETTIEVATDGRVKAKTSDITTTNGVAAAATGTSLVTAGDVAKAINASGFTAKANNDTGEFIKSGDAVEFKDGDNIKITRSGGVFTIGTAAKVAFDKVTVGGVVIDKTNGIDAGGNKITNIAAGKVSATSTDAINGSQLHKLKTDLTGWSEGAGGFGLAAGDKGAVKQALGTTIQVVGDKDVDAAKGNISTTVADGKLVVNLGKDLQDLNSVTTVDAAGNKNVINAAGNTITDKDGNTNVTNAAGSTIADKDGNKIEIGAKGVTITPTGTTDPNKIISLTDKGLNNGGNKITNVGAGDIAKDSTDAVNAGQIHAISAANTTILGGNAKVNTDGKITMTDIGGTGEDNIHDAIAAVDAKAGKHSVVTAGKNVEISKNTVDGQTTYTVATKADVDFDSVTVGAVNIGSAGINAGDKQISNVAAGKAATDAANVSQLTGIADALGGGAKVAADGSITAPTFEITKQDGSKVSANNVGAALDNLNKEVIKPITFAGNSGSSAQNLGSTFAIKGADANTDFAKSDAGKNIYTKVENGKVTIGMAKNVEVESVSSQDAAGNKTVTNAQGVTITSADASKQPVSLTASGLNNGGNQITNVKSGLVDAGGNSVSIADAKGDMLNNSATIGDLQQAVGTVIGSNIADLYRDIDKAKKQASAGTAAAMATANLPQPHDPGANLTSFGLANYNGESAIAIGVSTVSDNGKWIVKGSLTQDTQNNQGVGVGVGYQW